MGASWTRIGRVRAIFLVLLTANLLFLAWARWIDEPRETAARDAYSRLPRLQLATDPAPGGKPTSLQSPLAPPIESVAQRTSLQLSDPSRTCTSVGPFNDITSVAR